MLIQMKFLKNNRIMNAEVWNCKECAEFLGRSEGAIRNLILRRAIPYRKAGGRLIFLPQEIEKWVTSSPGIRLEELIRDD